ncbi:MAG TPA: serine protease [Thermomicrobiales bacterium]|jgi:hypothetical protein|nr:serine protease [Thermomicrobiales bacterium]
MDPRPFDGIARALASGRSRRDALRALATIWLGVSGMATAAGSVGAKGGAPDNRSRRPPSSDRPRHKGPTPQIAGGTPVPPGKYPFAASVRMHGVAGDFLCSGSLIDASHVLTAAHCTFDLGAARPFPLDAYVVLVGQVDRTSTSCAACRKGVAAVAVDPAWTGAGLEIVRPHDVAVLTLDAPVPAAIAQPIALIDSGGAGLDAAGQSAIAAGWGITTTDGDASNVLMEAPLTVLGDAACGANSTQLCTQVVGGRATCSGDSGGPLFVEVAETAAGSAKAGQARAAAHHPNQSRRRRCRTRCPFGCVRERDAVCCPPNDAAPDGSFCHAGSECCPPSDQFPAGSCVPTGTPCGDGGGGGGSRFVQIALVNGGPAGCPSADGTSDVYARLSNPDINAFVRNAAPAT